MSTQKLSYIVCFFFICYIHTLIAGCKKEYSFEGDPRQDSTILPDSTITEDSTKAPGISFPTCKNCNSTDTSSTFKWSFQIGSSFLCGNVTNAVLSPDGNGMTFFGPSTCSEDSGLIITAYFRNQSLNQDQSNITADRAALEYYDNTTLSDILQSKRPNIFSLTIDSYIRQTGITTGTFGGWVVDKNGDVIKVDAGRFKIKF
ncbi:MAG: hypothetical protein H0V14_10660 [Chitinophagaceae bacterium]|nr:hypothetical protein [Chitinophagaceae bacterium]